VRLSTIVFLEATTISMMAFNFLTAQIL